MLVIRSLLSCSVLLCVLLCVQCAVQQRLLSLPRPRHDLEKQRLLSQDCVTNQTFRYSIQDQICERTCFSLCLPLSGEVRGQLRTKLSLTSRSFPSFRPCFFRTVLTQSRICQNYCISLFSTWLWVVLMLLILVTVPPSVIIYIKAGSKRCDRVFFKYLQVQLVSWHLFTFNKHLKQEQVGSVLVFAFSLCLAACTWLMWESFLTHRHHATYCRICVFI